MTVAASVYIGARSVSLGAVGRKVDVVERAIRRGTGQDPELAEALARDEAGDYSLRKLMGYRHLPKLRAALKQELKIDATAAKTKAA